MISFDFEQSLIEGNELAESKRKQIEQAVNENLRHDGTIGIRFVTDREIQKLNRMYRKKDKVTDVLSFGYGKEGEQLGDIAISYDQAQRQAHGEVEHEVINLIVHGILHVLGYDHERPGEDREMFSLQDKIVEQII